MKLPRRQFLHLVAGAAALPAVSRVAWAQAYPSRPVRIISPFGTAGANGSRGERGLRADRVRSRAMQRSVASPPPPPAG
jgi:hypothetical protein